MSALFRLYLSRTVLILLYLFLLIPSAAVLFLLGVGWISDRISSHWATRPLHAAIEFCGKGYVWMSGILAELDRKILNDDTRKVLRENAR